VARNPIFGLCSRGSLDHAARHSGSDRSSPEVPMNTFRKPAAVLAFTLMLVSSTIPASQAGPGSDVAGVHAADKAWETAYNAGKVEDVVALYDENAVVFPPGVAPVRGRAAIRAFFEKDLAAFAPTGMSLVLGDKPEGGVSGDMGWASGTWTAKDKSGQVLDSGWYFSVSRKVRGKWLYLRDGWNSDKPAPTAAAEK